MKITAELYENGKRIKTRKFTSWLAVVEAAEATKAESDGARAWQIVAIDGAGAVSFLSDQFAACLKATCGELSDTRARRALLERRGFVFERGLSWRVRWPDTEPPLYETGGSLLEVVDKATWIDEFIFRGQERGLCGTSRGERTSAQESDLPTRLTA